MSIKSLPSALRPREKMLSHGPSALADSELLALLLRTGLPGKGVLQLAEDLLERFKGFAGLLRAQPADFSAVKGIGPARQAELGAVFEIGRRALAQQLSTQPVFESTGSVKQYAAMQLSGLRREVFCAMFLDAGQRLIEWRELFHGTLTRTEVYPREVLTVALELDAAAVVLAHNHPSGNAEPSKADEFITQRVMQALALLDIKVLDHLVVGDGQVVSMSERGLL